MIQSFLTGGGFYYSTTFDISHSLQWLGENDSPTFQQSSMIQRVGYKIKTFFKLKKIRK